jgi:Flp pilus assembly protein TadG
MYPDEHEAAVVRRERIGAPLIAYSLRLARSVKAQVDTLGNGGAALVEFALVAPMLLLIVFGTAQFGVTLGQYVMLTNAVGVGAMQFAISRGDTTPSSDAWTAITTAASTLTAASIKMTLMVNATACVTNASTLSAAQAADTTCMNALTNNVGKPAQVSASYTATFPCNLLTTWQGMASTCNLASQVTERVQ